MDAMRLDKLLSNMGYGSRSEIKKMINRGSVSIDRKVIRNPSFKVNPIESIVNFEGKQVFYRKFTYLMLNKPAGIVSSTDSKDTNVIDILDEKYKHINLSPAGRLDKDTEGLIILTNDGLMAHNILSPKKKNEKKYYVEIDGSISPDQMEMLENGMILKDGEKCLPSRIEILESDEILCKLNLYIIEGKYHQVKRMFAALGRKVNYLKRISIGKIVLDDNLATGEYRELSEIELKNLPVSKD
ncbi:MAG: Pseudouridine synthase [Clostridiales bacterium 38_11]|nr:MAG: Pseudouridine synthase [Clostridiales bacterium 38_11]HBH11756.1 16S rRNA pseudouridine(516) synthase [Clostridiales bacterium]